MASPARRERVKEREMGRFYPVNSFQLIGPPEYNRLPVRQSKIARCEPKGGGERFRLVWEGKGWADRLS